MTPEIRHRLTLVEKSLQRLERPTFPDTELIRVMRSKQARPEHLQALCDRIAEPFLASLVLHGESIRTILQMGEETPPTWGPITEVAVALAFENDSQMPETVDPYHYIEARGGFPQPNDRVMDWKNRVLGVLLSELVNRCGGLNRMRDMVSEARGYSYLPIYTVEEADVLADLVDTVEVPHWHWDAAVLVWRGPDGDLYSSRKPSLHRSPARTGQKWTRGNDSIAFAMSREEIAEINKQTPYRPLIEPRV
jgi:hypothetical protein